MQNRVDLHIFVNCLPHPGSDPGMMNMLAMMQANSHIKSQIRTQYKTISQEYQINFLMGAIEASWNYPEKAGQSHL